MPPETVSTEKEESSNSDHFLNKSLHSSLILKNKIKKNKHQYFFFLLLIERERERERDEHERRSQIR